MKIFHVAFGLLSASLTLTAPTGTHEAVDDLAVRGTGLSTNIRPSAFPTRSPREDIDLHPLEGDPFDTPGPVIPTSIPAAAANSNPIPVPVILPRTTLELTTEQKLNHFARMMQMNLAGPASAFYCAQMDHHWEATCIERSDANLTAIAGVRIASFYATGMMLADFSLAERILQRIRTEQKKQTEDTLVHLYAEVLDCAKADMDHLRKSMAEFTAKSVQPKSDGGQADGGVLSARGFEPKHDEAQKAAAEADEIASINGGW